MVTDANAGPAIIIRRATQDDIEALVALVNEAYRRSEGHVFPGSTRTGRGDLLKEFDHIIVAEREGRPVACVYFRMDGERAHFGMLATDVDLQGAGIGSALIEHVEGEARARGCAVMHIDVVKEAGRVPFYERRGYRVVGETPGQTWNGGANWGAAMPWHMVDMEKPLR